MASVNVQFREDPAVVAYVRKKGLTPSEVAKRAFEREVRALRAADLAAELAALDVPRLPEGQAARWVREARDAR